jgi:hypothetical protein
MLCPAYRPRAPEQTTLYQAVSQHFEAFKVHVAEREKYLPKYVEDEFMAFLECGRLENGFARLKCKDCDHERLLAFSCKRRGFCPSCCGRRMNESEMKLVEAIIPKVPVRQWVLSLPFPIRFAASRDRKLINLLVKVFYDGVEALIRRKLRSKGIKKAKGGGVVFIQRIGGALNLNVHFHAIFLNGAYTTKDETATFHSLENSLTSEDVVWVTEKVALRSVRLLAKYGYLEDEHVVVQECDGVALCDQASIAQRIAYGERSGQAVRRIRLPVHHESDKAVLKGDLTAALHGFNVKPTAW